ncbi:MAG: 1-(5-phosphoribosyl)-5-[Christensenellaceae bacterium]|nr:1-(5-phosphoribosyl)-5-[(5-phosphoribosylamino)methylideneamino]imidazole-4-carboxamide isomerase [Christensenellaceae bacterium]
MLIFPAIDLYEAKAVRLFKGDYNKMTVYSEHPEEVAKSFVDAGAEWIHLVDLEGARDGNAVNFDVIERIASTGLKCEVGGGIRTEETVRRYLDAGIDRIILGTVAVSDRNFLSEMCAKYKGHIAVGADIKDGRIAVRGWTEVADTGYAEFCKELDLLDIDALICTDISRDGAMRGTNTELYKELSENFAFKLIASGGVSSMEDVVRLKELNIYGAIIGKALYTGDICLVSAIEAAK